MHLARGGTYADFGWYLKIIKSQSTNPHAGYGIGNERVLQYIFAERDIRNVSLFSLLNKQSQDWHEKHYGQAALFSADKKQLLLTIGKLSDKKKLLPFIAKLNQNYTLYATEKTHQFLDMQGVKTVRVYKISEIGNKLVIYHIHKPFPCEITLLVFRKIGKNKIAHCIGSKFFSDLLKRRVFDLVINIPQGESKDLTDGKLIRRVSAEAGISLITDLKVAKLVLENLCRH